MSNEDKPDPKRLTPIPTYLFVLYVSASDRRICASASISNESALRLEIPHEMVFSFRLLIEPSNSWMLPLSRVLQFVNRRNTVPNDCVNQNQHFCF